MDNEEFKMNEELYHHGILGQRWGIIRSKAQLGHVTKSERQKTKEKVRAINEKTKAKVKAIKVKQKNQAIVDKAKAKADAKIAKAKGEKVTKDKTSTTTKQKPKSSTSDLTDDELRNKISRIRLENEYKSLNPQQVSAGQKFMNSMLTGVIAPAATNVAKQYLEKTLKDKLGLSEKKQEDALAGLKKEVDKLRLEKERENLKNPKSDPYADMREELKNHSTKKAYDKMKEEQSKTYSGTVEGEETSGKTSGSSYSFKKDDIIDADWYEVHDADTSSGRNYIAGLLEDKSKK